MAWHGMAWRGGGVTEKNEYAIPLTVETYFRMSTRRCKYYYNHLYTGNAQTGEGVRAQRAYRSPPAEGLFWEGTS